jgi:tetratricopeptide (TPR) repeat protein
VKLWDAASGQELLSLKGHAGFINDVAFSPDSKRLASASWDKTVKLWDAASGQEVLSLKGQLLSFNFVKSVAFSPDGKRIVAEEAVGGVRAWDAGTGQAIVPCTDAPPEGTPIALSADGSLLAAADGLTVRVVRTADNRPSSDLLFLPRLNDPRLALQWHRDEAASAEKAGDSFAAAFHLRRLIQLHPTEPALLRRRAAALAKLGHALPLLTAWTEALPRAPAFDEWATAEDYRQFANEHFARQELAEAARARGRVVDLEPHALPDWRDLTEMTLAAGQTAEYGKICARMLEQFQDSVHPDVQAELAWRCCLIPGVLPDPARAVRLAEEAVQWKPTPFRLRVLTAALYRAGRFEEALKQLEEGVKLHGKGGSVEDWLWLALAHQKLGHAEQASELLTKATAFLDQTPPETNIQKLEWPLLRKEAETAINAALRK